MKISRLIHELQKYDGDAEVAVYMNSNGIPLWIPDYNPERMVATDEELASEYNFPKDTAFILGK